MPLSWNAIDWLKANYKKDDLAIAFFLKGEYLPTQKETAEKEFEEAVNYLNDNETDDQIKDWAKLIIVCEFRIIYNTGAQSFWTSSALRSNIHNDLTRTETYRFKNWTSSNFQAPPPPPPPQQESSRRRISIEENDNIWFTDCEDSVFSMLKTKISNTLHRFDTFDDTEKYFTTIAMNNVLELSDDHDKSHKTSFTHDQVEELNHLIPGVNVDISNTFTDTIKERLAKVRKNDLSSAFSMMNSISQASKGNEAALAETYRNILKNFIHTPEQFTEENLEKLSEFDYILNFWGPAIKDMFIGTNIWAHWGDTESRDCEQHKFRMDLRLLCRLYKKSFDHAAGEFAHTHTTSKYYHDRKKLVLNGINQIHNILKTYEGNPSDIKLPIFQALGFEGTFSYLYRFNHKHYVIKKVSTFFYPSVRSNLLENSMTFVNNLLLMKNSVVEMEDLIQEAVFSKKKNVRNSTSSPSLQLWLKP